MWCNLVFFCTFIQFVSIYIYRYIIVNIKIKEYRELYRGKGFDLVYIRSKKFKFLYLTKNSDRTYVCVLLPL